MNTQAMEGIMKKGIFILTAVLLALMLTGCGSTLSEDDLVDNGQAFEMKQVGDDLQASNFPMEEREKRLITLDELRGEVTGVLGERYLPDVPVSEGELERLTGITKDMYVEYLAERQASGEQIDTMILIHAKEDSVGAVEAALEQYRADVIARNADSPEDLGKAEASRMETIENYVCFIQLGADTSGTLPQGQDAVSGHCLEENEKAIYVLEQMILQ